MQVKPTKIQSLMIFSLFGEDNYVLMSDIHTCMAMLSLDKGHAVYCFSHKLQCNELLPKAIEISY